MKRRIVSIILAFTLCCGFTAAAQAEQAPAEPGAVTEAVAYGQAAPRIVDVGIKTRMYNGRPQYRRYDKSTGEWIDPYWIYF